MSFDLCFLVEGQIEHVGGVIDEANSFSGGNVGSLGIGSGVGEWGEIG